MWEEGRSPAVVIWLGSGRWMRWAREVASSLDAMQSRAQSRDHVPARAGGGSEPNGGRWQPPHSSLGGVRWPREVNELRLAIVDPDYTAYLIGKLTLTLTLKPEP